MTALSPFSYRRLISLRMAVLSLAVAVFLSITASSARAADQTIAVADGRFSLEAPADWKRVQPRVRIVEAEFAIPASEGDDNDGRLTVMGAGGSIEQNIDRWIGQFTQADGGSTKERTKTEKKSIAGCEVHLVDIAGTFSDRRGPFAPAVERPDYRMLAAIVETGKFGNYFVKFYGPVKTVSDNEKAFEEMIAHLKKN
ncbi:MAG: hypothetical protein KDA42_13920 [Planctomycetales bacterium]|nr:hypothetical protein [Planctomycetales bacterium]